MFKNLGKLTLEERDFILSNKKLIEKNIDIILVKRYDTISEMLKVAKSYAKHEEKVFTELVTLRQGGSIQETNQVLANQNDVLTQIRAVGESYPELFSSKQFKNSSNDFAIIIEFFLKLASLDIFSLHTSLT